MCKRLLNFVKAGVFDFVFGFSRICQRVRKCFKFSDFSWLCWGCLLKLFPMLSFSLCLPACPRLFEVAECVLGAFYVVLGCLYNVLGVVSTGVYLFQRF